MSQAAGSRPGAQVDGWVRSTLDVLAGIPAVHRAGLAVSEGGGRRLLFTATDRDNQAQADWCEVDAYEDVPLNNAVRTGALIVGDLDVLALRYPDFVSRQGDGTQAIASVPLSTEDRTIGGFALYYRTRQPFDDAQLVALRELGRSLGIELRRSQRGLARLSTTFAEQPPSDGARVAALTVDPDPRAVGPARQFARATLMAWGVAGDPTESAVLCVSELVTNAVMHTVAGCEVKLVLGDGVLTILVRDAGVGGGLFGPAEDLYAVHGRGLGVVEALSTRWGFENEPAGMTVWCELLVA